MGSSGSGETGSQIENGGGLSGVGDAQVCHLRVELGESIDVGGEGQFDVVGHKSCASGGLNFIAVVGELLKMSASVLLNLFDDGAHSPTLASSGH